jgi:hypothetical protein
MMNEHERIQDRLHDFVDDTLPPVEHASVLDHVDGCDECRAELESLLALREEARSLPREIAPRRDLWPEIQARLQPRAPAGKVIEVDFRAAARRPAWHRWARMAAAAVVLVALSSSITAYLLGGRGGTTFVRVPVPMGQPTALAAFHPTEQEYIGTLEALQGELTARRGELAPQTVATIEENLRIIDRAIRETRAALEADPGNADLPLLLSDVYRKKVELLESALQLPAKT